MNNISVVETDNTNGIDSIVWYHPFDLDTSVYDPPYFYKVFNSQGQAIYQGNSSSVIQNLDSSISYITNTTDTNRFYSVVFTINLMGWILY